MNINLKPEITADIKFYPNEDGSPRAFPSTPPILKCRLLYAGEYFDCELFLDKFKPPAPGGVFKAPIKFLWPEGILPRLKLKDGFQLWEGGVIGEGQVVEIKTLGAVYDEIKATFSPRDLAEYNGLLKDFADLTSGKNNEDIWQELKQHGDLPRTLDTIHKLRHKYHLLVPGQPFYTIRVPDPNGYKSRRGQEPKTLEKSWG
jgi:hypothetical protein